MAINIYPTETGLSKFRAALEGGSKITLDHVEIINDDTDTVETTLSVSSIGSDAAEPTVYRFTVQDKSDDEYECHRVKAYDTDGDVILESPRGVMIDGGNAEPFFTKQAASEIMVGFEVHFQGGSVDSVIAMGDVVHKFDSATEELEGVVELATEAEAKAGTDVKRAITPKTLKAKLSEYLPLIGGTLTGALTISKGDLILTEGIIKKGVKTDGLDICSGTSYADSPALSLYPTDYAVDSAMAGRLVLRVGANDYHLVLKPDGTLLWDGSLVQLSGTIKTSENKALVKTDTKGGVQICGGTSLEDGGAILGYGKDYESNAEFKGALRLQATNGTQTYDVVLFPNGRLRLGNDTRMNFQDNEDQHIFIDGNGDLLLGDMNGAFVRVCGQESGINPSGIQFRVQDADGNKTYLIANPDGTLKWGNLVFTSNAVISGEGSDKGLMLFAGSDNFDGATLQLFHHNQSTYPGMFYLRASSQSSLDDTTGESCDLIGKPDGTLTWGGKEVLRAYNSSSWRIVELGGGMVMMYTADDYTGNSGDKTYTLPIPMGNTDYAIFTAVNVIGGGYNEKHNFTRTTTNFVVNSSDGSLGFIVIGTKA